jgi:hypothetical protein
MGMRDLNGNLKYETVKKTKGLKEYASRPSLMMVLLLFRCCEGLAIDIVLLC